MSGSPNSYAIFGLIAMIASFSMTGCGGQANSGPPLYPVTGVVTKGGVPVPNLSVALMSVDPKMKAPAVYGTTDAEGAFVVKTSAGGNGAALGHYAVVLIPPTEQVDYSTQQGPPKKSDLVPEVYTQVMTSPIRFEVTKNKNHIDVKL